MPSQILHHLFGEDALRIVLRRFYADSSPADGMIHLQDLEEALLERHRPVFALGCQGPDLFYHSRRTRPVAIEYGTLAHRRGYGRLAVALLERARCSTLPQAQSAALTAYALGFMTHAFLDRALHPYIVFRAGWVVPSRPETRRFAYGHPFLERIIDVLMLELLRGQRVTEWDQAALLVSPCSSPPEGLPELLAQGLAATYPERAGRDPQLDLRICNAFSDAAGFYRMTNPRQTARLGCNAGAATLALVYPERLPLDIDYLNLGKNAWREPGGTGREDRRSVPELYAEARETLAGVIAAVLGAPGAGPVGAAGLAATVGNGSLSIRDELGRPCAPRWSDPFPLARLLDQQGEYRVRYSPPTPSRR